ILERFEKELAARTSRELAAQRQRIVTTLEPIVEALGAPEAIARLADAVAGEGATGTPAAFVRCASFMGRHGVTAAVSAYLKATTDELRSTLNQFLAANAERNPGELTRLCAATVSVETAKWALFTASKHLRGPLAESLFAQGLQHPEAAVRDYANFLWRTHTPAGRMRAFLDTLDVPDVGERVRAAEAIGRSKDYAALDPLKKLVDDPKFLDRTAEEKRAILGAIAAIGGTDSAGFLMRQTDRQTGLFRRRAGAEVRDAAAKLLEGLKRPPPTGPGARGTK
ncbi:MAG: HEAT repeat domain-containing protein, partial [Planctomycetota bacterium]